jgi:hypothetical protein
LVAAVRLELTAADRLASSLGQQALVLARRIGSAMDTGASTASVSRELREVMVKALAGAVGVADPVDELEERRRVKLGAAG